MNCREHAQRDDMKVWLSVAEVDHLLEAAADTQHRIAFALGARCGLRSHEILDVAPRHVQDTDAGLMLRVHAGKGDQYRETPMPQDLATTIRTVADVRDAGPTRPLIETTNTRTLRRWINKTVEELAVESDPMWRYVTMHDLRRTWASALRNAGVDAHHVLEWGGWNDLETFLDHYKGEYTPAAQRRQREKVDWL